MLGGYDSRLKSWRITTLNSEDGVNTPLDINFTSSSGYSFLHLDAITTGTLVKTGSGVLHSITINNIGSAPVVTVYDGTSTAGTVIGILGGTLNVGTLSFDAQLATGLYVVIAGTTAPDITLSYN